MSCVLCVFSSHSFWTSNSLDVPVGVTQEEGHTGFLIHLLYAVRALIFSREGISHSFPSSTVKSWQTIFKVVVVDVDSHIQRIVLATEETTVTQQVSHRPIRIQIATKSYAALQAMAPTNIKTVHQTSLLHSRATSIDSECCRLPTTSVLSKKPEKLRSNQF